MPIDPTFRVGCPSGDSSKPTERCPKAALEPFVRGNTYRSSAALSGPESPLRSSAELFQYTAELMVNFSGLADDQHFQQIEIVDRSLAADKLPGFRFDGVLD